MCADKSDGEKEFLLDFLEVYQALPSLWDAKCNDYKNRDKRAEDNEILLRKYKERYPTAVKKDMNKKIHTLRSNFRREIRRMKELIRSGAVMEEDIVPNLWYFDALSFLQDEHSTIDPLSNIEIFDAVEDEEKYIPHSQNRKRKTYQSDEYELPKIESQSFNRTKDIFQKGCDFWAAKLESMRPNQAYIAEKLIGEVLLYGQMNQLEMGAYVVKSDRSTFSSILNSHSTSPSSSPSVCYIGPPPPSPKQQRTPKNSKAMYIRPSKRSLKNKTVLKSSEPTINTDDEQQPHNIKEFFDIFH